MSGVVVFDPAEFIVIYPAFAAVNPAILSNYFNAATFYLNNTDSSKICDLIKRKFLLYLLTAHLAQLAGAANGGVIGSTAGQVGHMSSATEGSVSVSFEYQGATGTAAWYAQTQYGLQYWSMTQSSRRFRYVGPPRCC